MTVHLVKLCVGASSIADLEDWIAERQAERARLGLPAEQVHTTRMSPRRRDSLLAGGSLYWVIRGLIQCRQRLKDIRSVVGDDGIERCALVLEPRVVPVVPRPRAPFQGWRYLAASEAPADLDADASADAADMPDDMRRELAALGLL
ncbi:hypothetical protein EDC22_102425 [Tepidamorphus gemmatus]|jgi:hypothetical protein|uniref:DUF1489 family protein n=1 Tax=Tepidamorphus gemmatus TaxID=747076 RepID=A0A4R3MFU8_9HYPH|nr:DUF1489 family protein [Tepidamorphus gemmatus]TCT12739.1 hypothetical protein EDC22_102425 [Tepidamorphus gemmatus]